MVVKGPREDDSDKVAAEEDVCDIFRVELCSLIELLFLGHFDCHSHSGQDARPGGDSPLADNSKHLKREKVSEKIVFLRLAGLVWWLLTPPSLAHQRQCAKAKRQVRWQHKRKRAKVFETKMASGTNLKFTVQ